MENDQQEDQSPERPLFRDVLEDLAVSLSRNELRLRRAIAERLHDHLQQLLASARIYTQLAAARVEPGETRQNLDEANRLLVQALELTREVTLDLCPRVVYDEDLPSALQWLTRHTSETRGLNVRFAAEGPLPPVQEEHRALLFEAVRGLLSNALRLSGTGEAAVRLGASEKGLELEVEDSGGGFDLRDLHSEEEGGIDLGNLKERLRLAGIEMRIEDRPGGGGRAVLTVPSAVPREATAPPPAGKGKAIRVLVVDDHKIMREGIIAMLTPLQDIEVVGEAANGREAVELAHELEPDVILMDVSMPVMNGFEATRRIREETPGPSIIALSMFDDPQIAESMRRAGAAAYLTKGDQADQLVATIRRIR